MAAGGILYPVRIGGPWRGLSSSVTPNQLQPQYVTDCENVRYYYGKLSMAPAKRVDSMFKRIGGDIIRNIIGIFYVTKRSGNAAHLIVCRNAIYWASVDKIIDVSCDGWSIHSDNPVTLCHYVTDGGEWLVLSTSERAHMFRWNLVSSGFEVVDLPTGVDYIDIVSARYITKFAGRLILVSPRTNITEYSNKVGWFGIHGPFDNTFPTAGVADLADSPGPITAFAHLGEFLVITKASAVYLCVDNSVNSEMPIRIYRRLTDIGAATNDAITTIASGRAVAFMAPDKVVYIYDGQNVQAISQPVDNILRERDTRECKLFTDIGGRLLHVVYPDVHLLYNYTEGWWTRDTTVDDLVCIMPSYVKKMARSVNDLGNVKINSFGRIKINRLGNCEAYAKPCFVTKYAYVTEHDGAVNRSWIRSCEIRFEHPTAICRAEILARAERGGSFMVRHSTDGGGTWSQWTELSVGDRPGNTRVFYDFVATSDRFMFEVMIRSVYVTIEDIVLETEVHHKRDDVPRVLNVDAAPSGWTTIT